MKRIILASACLCTYLCCNAQMMDTATQKQSYPKHSRAVEKGKATLLTGSCLAAAGGACLFISTRSTNPSTQATGFYLGLPMLAYGSVGLIAGISLWGGGLVQDALARRKISVVGKQNEIGLAYNF